MEKKLPSYTFLQRYRREKFALASVLFMIFYLPVCSQELVKDINQAMQSGYTAFASLRSTPTQMFFIYESGLWVSKGTPGTTVLVKSFRSIGNLTVVGNIVYFAADDNTGGGTTLWKSNGTSAGTFRLKNPSTGQMPGTPAFITAFDNTTIYFSATNAPNGRELWKSNGTHAGTVMVKDILKVKGSSSPSWITKAGNTIFFAANDGQNGIELWKSNGTAEGTVLVKNINVPARASSAPELLTAVNGILYFRATDGISNFELYRSDGTEAGTYMVKDIGTGGNKGDVENLINVNNTLFFTANDGSHGDELWKSNGTEAGTVMVKDLNPGPGGSNNTSYWREPMGNFTNVNGVLFFTAGKGTAETFIVRSDGTEAGTYKVTNMEPVGLNDLQPNFTYLDNHVYFFSSESRGSYYLTRADLSGQNIEPVRPYPTPEDFYETFTQELVQFDNALYTFTLYDRGWAFVKQSTDGSISVVKAVVGPTVGSYPEKFTKVNDQVFFLTHFEWPGEGDYLYSTDGTLEGTIERARVNYYSDILGVGNNLFFTIGNELWVTQSSMESQHRVKFFEDYSDVQGLTDVNGTLYFHNGYELWKSDGTEAGTVKVRSLNSIRNITNVGGKAYILNVNASEGLEVWRTNATGLLKVKVIRESFATPHRYNISAGLGNIYFFVANDGVHGNEIWRSDGTAVGTFMVQDLNTIDSTTYNGEVDIRSFMVFKNKLYFSAADANNDWKYYYVSGKNSVTEIGPLNPATSPVIYHDKLYLFAQRYDSYLQLWSTDGTPGSLNFIADVGYGWVDHTFVNGELYYAKNGGEVMQVTDCGVFPLNINAPYVNALEGFGDHLLLSAEARGLGVEPLIYRNVGDISHSCEPETARMPTREEQSVFAPWPNPYTTDFTLRVKGADGERADVAVYNASGFPVDSFNDIATNTDYANLGAYWPKGIYVVKVTQAGKITTHRLVKK
jgi:ELWxxDGT repeat protein